MARAVVLLALALFAVVVSSAQAAVRDVVLVSRAGGAAGVGADDISRDASISADGRFVAFASLANNLSDQDNDGLRNVYVRDLRAGITTLVSRASGHTGEGSDGYSSEPSISADGRYVAFRSEADNLTGDDVNDQTGDVFVRDLLAGTTTYVSRAGGPGGDAADFVADEPSISADGRYVAFQSAARNLGDGGGNAFRDIFVRDLEAHTTTFVSRASDAAGAGGDAASLSPSMSADGRFVAFHSFAGNLADTDVDATLDVFVRDLRGETTTHASQANGADGAGGGDDSLAASISTDGRLVAFESDATNLTEDGDNGGRQIFVRDLQGSSTRLVSGAIRGGALAPSISAGGRFVAFEQEANAPAGEARPDQNIFTRDLQANTTAFVGRASPDEGEPQVNQFSFSPSISADGRFVAFGSESNSLSREDNDAVQNVFVRDLRPPPPAPPAPTPSLPPPTLVLEPARPADTTGPVLTPSSPTRGNRTVRVSRRGRFRLFCGRFAQPVTGACGGRSMRPRRKGGFALGRRSFSAPAGQRVMVRFRLTRAGLARLTRLRKVRMRGALVARDALGNATSARFRFTLAAPRRRP